MRRGGQEVGVLGTRVIANRGKKFWKRKSKRKRYTGDRRDSRLPLRGAGVSDGSFSVEGQTRIMKKDVRD